MVGRNGPPQAHRALGEGERGVRMHQTQDMIRKERPDSQGAENPWGGGGSSGRERYVSGVKVAFADGGPLLLCHRTRECWLPKLLQFAVHSSLEDFPPCRVVQFSLTSKQAGLVPLFHDRSFALLYIFEFDPCFSFGVDYP